ncbi:MAG: tRNA (cytidine(56)-2'-O)-methyltransferase [Candidatus Syntrophoarchaeum sp.]|nr:tRNA (cytidine(56)-2'-O)-methyltransferase [Candidatus Syntrophoarchaeum sp.]
MNRKRIVILRIGHRIGRDKRITTHIGLAARALGASGMILTAEDREVEKSISDVVYRWGGDFWVKSGCRWQDVLKEWEGAVVHLTMYGESILNLEDEIRNCPKDLLVIIGAEKVPFSIYERSDWNVAITNQPHSELAAIAVFLDRIQQGNELEADFGGRIRIVGKQVGKEVIINE